MNKLLKWVLMATLIAIIAPVGCGLCYAYYLYYQAAHDPNRASVAAVLRDPKRMSEIDFSDGSKDCEVGSERRTVTTLDKIAPVVLLAFMAIEDDQFFEHNGVYWKGVGRAMLVNFKAKLEHKTAQQGASTFTQQVVKVLLLSPEKTMKRKVMEAALALELEEYLTEKLGSKKKAKDKIFEIYLNWIYLGNNRYGIEAASQSYFGKSAKDLNWVEAAALAAIPKSPDRYNPRKRLDPKTGKNANAKRRELVFYRLYHDLHWIDKATYEAVKKMPLKLVPDKAGAVNSAQNICDAGKERLRSKFCKGLNLKLDRERQACEIKISTLNTSVKTTIDRKLQIASDQYLRLGINAIAKRHPDKDVPYGAVVTIENATAKVLSMVSLPYAPGGQNLAFATQSVGSTMKAFVYGAGFELGLVSPETVFVDEEVRLDLHHPDKVWPSNYEPEFMGAINVRTAMAHSVNTVAVQAIARIDAENVIKFARKLGITSELANERALALGVSGISPLELANGYATFFRDGKYLEPVLFQQIGKEGYQQIGRQAMSYGAAAQVRDILRAVITEGTGRAVSVKLPVPAYGKTGTTTGHLGAWFVLCTDKYTVVVWVGHKDNTQSLGSKETGASAALPIALDIMHYLYTGAAAGAVYSMSTKRVDDSRVIEGEDIIEEETGPTSTTEETESEDDEPEPKVVAPKQLLQEPIHLESDNSKQQQDVVEDEQGQDTVELHQDNVELQQDDGVLRQDSVQLQQSPN